MKKLALVHGCMHNLSQFLLLQCLFLLPVHNDLNYFLHCTHDPVATKLSSHHLFSLLQQLHEHAAKWRDIGGALGFTQGELDTIIASPPLHTTAPMSWLCKMLSDWLQWAPGDGRGSTHVATLEKLKDALKQANLGATAQSLNL